MIPLVLPTHLNEFAELFTSKSLKSARAKIGAWRGNTFAHCCAGWLASCADTNNRQGEPLSPDNSQPLQLAPRKNSPDTRLSAGPGPRCSRLPLLAREFVRVHERYLIRQTNATTRGRSITIVIRGSALGTLGTTRGEDYEITHREALSGACGA